MNPVPSPLDNDPRADDPPISGDPRAGDPIPRSPLRIADDGRSRQQSGDANIDPFNVDDIIAIYCPTRGSGTPEQIAKEIDFEWKRYETYGMRDHAEYRSYSLQGWRPVQHADFPGRFAPAGAEGPVIVKDMIFMERPMRLTVQARMEELAKASRLMQAHRVQMATTPDGQAPRVVLADRTSREAIKIPD